MRKYERKFKESLFIGDAGEKLILTVDLRKVLSMKKLVDSLYNDFKILGFDKKRSDLTNRKNSKIIIKNTQDAWSHFKHILYQNNFTDSDIKKIIINRY